MPKNAQSAAHTVIYCDGASDEIAAELYLTQGPLEGAKVQRLPRLSQAPDFLRPLLTWERLDWVIAVNEEIRCTVELSRHGYTGDHGFQRFARLFRSASLTIPTIYFTPFSRTRLNELDEGQSSARNVAPELFETLEELEARFNVACVAIDWPVSDGNGQPAPLQDPIARPAMERLAELVDRIIAKPAENSIPTVAEDFPDLAAAMDAHAKIPYRGGDTRGTVELPIAIGSPAWVYQFLPPNYFQVGKAEKALASLALDSCTVRPVLGDGDSKLWSTEKGHAWVQYLGYQWRPDPSCGLIALSATKARTRKLPLVVVWPRVFSAAGGKRAEMLLALNRFKLTADGPLADEMLRHHRAEQVTAFRERVSTDAGQFGVFSHGSKIGRVLQETADALVLGDVVLTFPERD